MRANFQVTLETGFRRFPWIDDRASAAAGFDVQTPRPVAGFAAHVRDSLEFRCPLRRLTHDDLFVCSRAWVAVRKSRTICSWQVAHSSEPTNSAPGILGGARIVRLGCCRKAK